MGLSCHILRNSETNEIEYVESPINGESSILYDNALKATGNKEKALVIWASSYTDMFKREVLKPIDKSYKALSKQKLVEVNTEQLLDEDLALEIRKRVMRLNTEISEPMEATLASLVKEQLQSEASTNKTVDEVINEVTQEYVKVWDNLRKSGKVSTKTIEELRVLENKLEKKAKGSNTSTPFGSYNEGVRENQSVKGENIWVRNTDTKQNNDRTLLVQFSSEFLYGTNNTTPSQEERYYDKLYQNRNGYDRTVDFWEIPLWISRLAHSTPNTDVYVIRNIEEAQKFLKEAKYKDVSFSVLDVNVAHVEKITKAIPSQQFSVGVYNEHDSLNALDNVNSYKSVEEYNKAKGYDTEEGYSYKHFKGTKIIPRLKMSDGCKFKCAFCSIPTTIINTSQATIDQQIKSIADLDVRLIYMDDKTFGQASNYKYIETVYREVKKYNPDFEGFIIQTTAGAFNKLDESFIKRSGIKYIELGIESYNDEILKKTNKPATEKTMEKAANKIRKMGLNFIPNVIVGIDAVDKNTGESWGETEETYKRTLTFLERHDDIISHINVYSLALYEGTEMADNIEAKVAEDLNENVVEKTFHSRPEIHRKAMDAFTEQASRALAYDTHTERIADEQELQKELEDSKLKETPDEFKQDNVLFDVQDFQSGGTINPVYNRDKYKAKGAFKEHYQKDSEEFESEVHTIAEKFQDKYGITVNVVSDESKVDDKIKRVIKSKGVEGKVKGFYDSTTDTATTTTIIIRNLKTTNDVERTLIHEIAGHGGLKNLLGDKYRKVMSDVFGSMTQAQIDVVKSEYGKDTDNIRIAEEYLARRSEKQEDLKGLTKIIAKIKAIIRKLFPNLNYTDTDIINLLQKSREGLQRKAKQTTKQVKGDIQFSTVELDQPNTPEFKKWFGNSTVTENGKVGGKPKVMYHGTPSGRDFSIFNKDFGGRNGIWVSESSRAAEQFTINWGNDMTGSIMPVYIAAENILDYESPVNVEKFIEKLAQRRYDKKSENDSRILLDFEEIIGNYKDEILEGNWTFFEKTIGLDVIEELGYDGVYMMERGAKNLAIFDNTSIKSATGNIGTFDSANPNINFNLDENGETKFPIVAEYLNEKETQDIQALNNSKDKLDVVNSFNIQHFYTSIKTLGIKLKKVFFKDGLFVVNEDNLTNSELYTPQEIKRILEDEEVQDEIKETITAINREETINDLLLPYDELLGRFVTDEYTILGKRQRQDSNLLDYMLKETIGGITEPVIFDDLLSSNKELAQIYTEFSEDKFFADALIERYGKANLINLPSVDFYKGEQKHVGSNTIEQFLKLTTNKDISQNREESEYVKFLTFLTEGEIINYEEDLQPIFEVIKDDIWTQFSLDISKYFDTLTVDNYSTLKSLTDILYADTFNKDTLIDKLYELEETLLEQKFVSVTVPKVGYIIPVEFTGNKSNLIQINNFNLSEEEMYNAGFIKVSHNLYYKINDLSVEELRERLIEKDATIFGREQDEVYLRNGVYGRIAAAFREGVVVENMDIEESIIIQKLLIDINPSKQFNKESNELVNNLRNTINLALETSVTNQDPTVVLSKIADIMILEDGVTDYVNVETADFLKKYFKLTTKGLEQKFYAPNQKLIMSNILASLDTDTDANNLIGILSLTDNNSLKELFPEIGLDNEQKFTEEAVKYQLRPDLVKKLVTPTNTIVNNGVMVKVSKQNTSSNDDIIVYIDNKPHVRLTTPTLVDGQSSIYYTEMSDSLNTDFIEIKNSVDILSTEINKGLDMLRTADIIKDDVIDTEMLYTQLEMNIESNNQIKEC